MYSPRCHSSIDVCTCTCESHIILLYKCIPPTGPCNPLCQLFTLPPLPPFSSRHRFLTPPLHSTTPLFPPSTTLPLLYTLLPPFTYLPPLSTNWPPLHTTPPPCINRTPLPPPVILTYPGQKKKRYLQRNKKHPYKVQPKWLYMYTVYVYMIIHEPQLPWLHTAIHHIGLDVRVKVSQYIFAITRHHQLRWGVQEWVYYQVHITLLPFKRCFLKLRSHLCHPLHSCPSPL